MNSTCQVEQSTLFKNISFWTAPMVRVRPVPGEIQLWLTPIGFDAVDMPVAWKTLSPDEKQRSQRFECERDGGMFIRGRYQLRLLLANCMGIQPGEVEFTYADSGKPRVKEGGGLQFNISRSQECLAVALTMDQEIGVDMEIVDEQLPADREAAAHFCRSELEALESLNASDRPSMFYRIWTAKEALMKATGKGNHIDPSSVQVGFDSEGDPNGYLDPVTGVPRSDWKLKNMYFSSGPVVSVATSEECSLHVYQA